jgi:hypothetical protein
MKSAGGSAGSDSFNAIVGVSPATGTNTRVAAGSAAPYVSAIASASDEALSNVGSDP